MIQDRIYTPGLAQVAYIVADEGAKEAAIIDPRRDVGEYVQWAEERGMRFVAILETHVHADFVSGSLELAAATGAPIYSPRLGDVGFEHLPVDDGDIIHVGAIRLKALFTPGHTPEHMAYLLLPDAGSETSSALYSGDALFVGDVGRPDLLGDEATRGLSEQLFTTVTNVLKTLPDDVVVYPGHTAGSSCGKKIGDAPSTTIRAEKKGNYAFQIDDKDAFIDEVMRDMPAPPSYYPTLKKVNKAGATRISDLPAPDAMSMDDVKAAVKAGALVIDTRSNVAFGEGHIPGAVFAGYGGDFHTWMGWLAPYDRDLVLVGGGDGSIEEIVTALRQIGLDRISGFLDGGMAAWNDELATTRMVDTGVLAANLERLNVLDVRTDAEWQDGHIDGAYHLPASEITGGALPDLPGDGTPVAVICGSGYRSTVVSSLLQARGMHGVVNVLGGMAAWNDLSLTVAR